MNETSFYILKDIIFYNQSDGGIPHPQLWERIVNKFFHGLHFSNRLDLKNHCYGAERGRIVFNENGLTEVYGTRGVKPYEEMIKEVFNLNKETQCDFETDSHYRVLWNHTQVLCEFMPYFAIPNKEKESYEI